MLSNWRAAESTRRGPLGTWRVLFGTWRRASALRFGCALLTIATSELQLAGTAAPAQQTAPAAQLKIVVLEGEGAVNIIQQQTAVAPVVEVRDHNDLPVAGVSVTFSIGGSGASFGGPSTLTIVTNGAGRAVAAGLTPTSSGALQIGVSAAFQGQTAVATITQVNVLTAAQAASASAAAGSGSAAGGGGVSTTTVSVVGAAAAGAGLAVGLRGSSPTITSSPQGTGIRDVTVFTFAAIDGGTSATYAWDFGDSSSGSNTPTTHVYRSEGRFTVTLRVTQDGREQTTTSTVDVENLTGRWLDPGGHFDLNIVQQGGVLTGQWTHHFLPFGSGLADISPLSGTVSDPRTITLVQGGDCLTSLTTGTVSADLKRIEARGEQRNPFCTQGNLPYTFLRQ